MSLYFGGKEDLSTRGHVISEREYNGYSDSDFYATIWVPEQGRAVEVMWSTTRSHCDSGCVVDATEEVLAQYNIWREQHNAQWRAREAAIKLNDPHVGATVLVVNGRKVPAGTVGRVLNISRVYDRFARNEYDQLLIATDKGAFHVRANYCIVQRADSAVAQRTFDFAEAC